jgi:hypothetical protein
VREANKAAAAKAKFPSILAPTDADATAASKVGGGTFVTSLPLQPDTRVDLKDLTWEDKERVLRLLFAKINNVESTINALPQHTLENRSDGLKSSSMSLKL